jgi:nucleotide-binding universal stress UspA family protein
MCAIQEAARGAGVPLDTAYKISDYPCDAIVKAVIKKNAVFIIMTSHGRRGVEGLLLGSGTQKVPMHSKTPAWANH